MTTSVEKRIKKLRGEILKHNKHYYVLNKQLISDSEYDSLLIELERLENENPHLITPDSPTQFVGADLTDSSKTIKHKFPMLSIQNESDLISFDKAIRKKIVDSSEIEYVVELKIDGLSVNLNYVNGMLKSAATRGDGEFGEDILENVKTIKDIPRQLKRNELNSSLLWDIEVRGELYLSTIDFDIINEEQTKLGKRQFSNPRNLAAGIVKLKDSSLVAKRPLKCFAYSILSVEGDFNSQSENLELLEKLGFKINEYSKKCNSITEVIHLCNHFESIRDELPFQIDGAVVKVNSIRHQNILGISSKYPNWARAFKFPPEKKETKLKNVIWQVGRTGAITPVAELEPVRLAGSIIKRATLHNYDEIVRKKLRIGDIVLIEKGGDVIPKIVKVVEEKRPLNTHPITVPAICPECNSEVIKFEEEVAYYCQNPECKAQIKGRLNHFVSRSAMDIEGFGEAIVDLFVEKNVVKSFSDIYRLYEKREELLNWEGFGEKSVDSLLQSIEASKKQPFYRVLYAIGIRKLGQISAQIISEKHKTIDEIAKSELLKDIVSLQELKQKLINQKKEFKSKFPKANKNAEVYKNQFEQLNNKINEIGARLINSGWYRSNNKKEFVLKDKNGIGAETAKSVLKFFKSKEGMKTIKELKEIGLFAKRDESKTDIFNGKIFVLTGTLPSLSRQEAIKMILDNGGKVASGFSKSANFVLAGEDAGRKLLQAKELGLKIISEADLMDMLNEPNKNPELNSKKSKPEQLDMF